MQEGFQLSVVGVKAFQERSSSDELVTATFGDSIVAYRVRGVYGYSTVLDVTCPGPLVAGMIQLAQTLAYYMGSHIDQARQARIERDEDAS